MGRERPRQDLEARKKVTHFDPNSQSKTIVVTCFIFFIIAISLFTEVCSSAGISFVALDTALLPFPFGINLFFFPFATNFFFPSTWSKFFLPTRSKFFHRCCGCFFISIWPSTYTLSLPLECSLRSWQYFHSNLSSTIRSIGSIHCKDNLRKRTLSLKIKKIFQFRFLAYLKDVPLFLFKILRFCHLYSRKIKNVFATLKFCFSVSR